MKDRQIAVFGGSFNPFANHHLRIVEHLCERHQRVIVVPAVAHALKGDLIDFVHRYNMAKLAVEGLETTSEVVVSMVEAEMLRKQPPPVRTYELLTTLRDEVFRNEFRLGFVIGPDIPGEMDRWAKVYEIRRDFGFIEVPMQSMRATKIREAIRNGDAWWEKEVPPAVAEYIKMHGLYREDAP